MNYKKIPILWVTLLASVSFFPLTAYPAAPESGERSVPVAAEKGMVASAHLLASRAGVEILKKGGNAVDAAVATAMALGVVEPYASGVGGGGFMLIYLAERKETVSIDYREAAPLKASPRMYFSPDGEINWDEKRVGPRSVAVPGTVAGLSLALSKYGTMDLKTVMGPAIELAEGGYPVNAVLRGMMATYGEKLSRFPEASRIFLKNGAPFNAGETIRLKDLGQTYRTLAERGADDFYRGEIAGAIEKEMMRSGGLITREDLEAYRPILREPVKGDYRGNQILSMAPPSSGGTHVIQLLNILEGFPMKELGQNSADSIEIMAEAMKRVFSDRSTFMGDPDFVKVPVDKLVSKPYAAQIRKEMKTRAGTRPARPTPGKESDQTTHLSVADAKGNLVALTQTINAFFASGVVVPGTGILLNNEMNDFDPNPGLPNSIEPGKRPVSSISPTLVLRSGKPFLSIGMPGATRIISVLPQILVNLVDFGMNLQEAIDAPRVHYADGEIWMEPRVPAGVQRELADRGYKIELKKSFDLWFGGAQAVMIDPGSGKIYGGADPRRDGAVVGY